jgi:hypothetical protein
LNKWRTNVNDRPTARVTTWKFAGVLPQAGRALAASSWTLLILHGLLPALFAIAMRQLVGAVERRGLSKPPPSTVTS